MINLTSTNSANPQAFTPSVSLNVDGYVAIKYMEF